MWEMLLSLRRLQRADGPPHVVAWRRSLDSVVSASAQHLIKEFSPGGLSGEALATLRDGVFQQAFGKMAPPQYPATNELYSHIHTYWSLALSPYWPKIRAAVRADLSVRANSFAHDGIEGFLANLHPQARWNPPILELPYQTDRTVTLNGRGVLLVPSFFCGTPPARLSDPALQPLLIFAVDRSLAGSDGRPARTAPPALGALVGNTRARALTKIAMGPCSTTELATSVGVSVASGSQHATVLRNAGLITSRRSGGVVVHMITPLGEMLATGLLREYPGSAPAS